MERDLTAAVFPGQGAQLAGMGKDYFELVDISRMVYEEASDALGWDVAAMCFGDDNRLHLTEYTQPCILTTEVAMLRGLSHLYGFAPSIYGGHSLGEFTALVCAGVLPLSAAVKIVQYRGRLMQEATPVGFGGMAAIITKGLDVKVLDDAIAGLPLDIANINSSKQVVISGASEALPEAETRIKKAFNNKKDVFVIRLKVSAPFHSRFIRTIETDFASILHENRKYFNAQKAVSITSNYTGKFHTGEYEDLIRSLTLQVGHTVLWKDNMAVLARSAGEIYEIGPKQHLGDFFKTMNINCKSVISLTSAQAIMNSQS